MPVVLEAIHDSKMTGHFGTKKTFERSRLRYIWPGQRGDVDSYVRSCRLCGINKSALRPKAAMRQYQAGAPMERVHIDLLGPFIRSTKGNKYVLMVIDQFTRWLECFALPDMTALTVAQTLVTEFISRFGCPLTLHSDQGTQFESAVVRRLCELLGIKKTRTTAYHPASNGQVERFNRTLVPLLRAHTEYAKTR